MIETTIGIETWGVRRKPTKLDIIAEIASEARVSVLDISSLNLNDIKSILKVVKTHKHPKLVVPNSNRKAGYLEALQSVLPKTTKLDKLSVSALKTLVEALNNV